MLNKCLLISLVSLLFALFMGGAASDVAAENSVVLGTGGVTGVYYPAGRAICRLVNRSRSIHGVRCSVESSSGSLLNLNGIRMQELDIGITQSDWEYHAYHGTGRFSDIGPNPNLRSIFSIHTEPLTLVVRKDSGISHIDDIQGKRVNFGREGSGQYGTMQVLMEAKNWSIDDFSQVSHIGAFNQAAALCNKQIDVMVYVVGHPSGAIKEVTTSCDSTLLNIQGDRITRLVLENSYYRFATIPVGMYRGHDQEVVTFGVGASLVSSVHVDERVVYEIVKTVFENFDDFKNSHPIYTHLTKRQMISDGLSAPFHAGAVKYYKEIGLLK